MVFIQRQRTRSCKTTTPTTVDNVFRDKQLPALPIGVENISATVRSTKSADGKQNGLLKRVGSIFTPRKRPNLELQLVYSTFHQSPTCQSYDDSPTSPREYEADIRCPSGLGSAASFISKRSLPPSPFYPQNGFPYDPSSSCSQPYVLKRAISSPNLLRSLGQKVRGKTRPRGGTHLTRKRTINSVLSPTSKPHPRFPEEIISLILSNLPRAAVASCATISRPFLSPSRASLYGTIDTGPLTVVQLEKLMLTLSNRNHLAELVTTFLCPEWPSFFMPDSYGRSYARHRDALLTATFVLAIERMSNLTTLKLPAFDHSVMAHQTSFGLKSLAFLCSTMTHSETNSLFAWLDGQVNISTLRFPNLLDLDLSNNDYNANGFYMDDDTSPPQRARNSLYLQPYPINIRSSSLSPYSTPLPSPTSPSTPQTNNNNDSLFSSPTLLPNLTTLHATPTLAKLLAAPLTADTPPSRRPLESVWLNINTMLYTGLRPAGLMSSLSGISHLGLTFSPNVDRRSFEKVIGAAGASLGSVKVVDNDDDPFIVHPPSAKPGLQTLEISFQSPNTAQPGRNEGLYKSLQASLPRYNALTTLRLAAPAAAKNSSERSSLLLHHQSSVSEFDMIDLWAKMCPSLTSVSLFSGTQWSRHSHRPQW